MNTMTLTDPRRCSHDGITEDIKTSHGEVVAKICTDCYTQLPAAWGCTECDWQEAPRTFADPAPRLFLATPCRTHRHSC